MSDKEQTAAFTPVRVADLSGEGRWDFVNRKRFFLSAMGWELRCEVYSTLSERWGSV
jgi:hypothetical protein